ncbi:MAG: sugar ABC transporter ATP-binding protein, partial [Caldilineaceae bacterium]|nr:sugar ABC transporter ATP-binding protein [Caldilineaceae bacterium]
RQLSGGNQQKVMFARAMGQTPRLLLLDEPTRGVDVGAKAEIHAMIDAIAARGGAVVVVSSELPEVLALAHRIVVMHEGRITGILDRADASEEALMAYATGIADDFAVPAEVSS